MTIAGCSRPGRAPLWIPGWVINRKCTDLRLLRCTSSAKATRSHAHQPGLIQRRHEVREPEREDWRAMTPRVQHAGRSTSSRSAVSRCARPRPSARSVRCSRSVSNTRCSGTTCPACGVVERTGTPPPRRRRRGREATDRSALTAVDRRARRRRRPDRYRALSARTDAGGCRARPKPDGRRANTSAATANSGTDVDDEERRDQCAPTHASCSPVSQRAKTRLRARRRRTVEDAVASQVAPRSTRAPR
jgi:hypothetical protein